MFTCFWSFNGKVTSKPFWNVIMLWWVQRANNHWIAIFFSANWGTVIDSSLQLVKIYFSLILVLKGTGYYTMKIPRIFDKHFFTPITFHSFEMFYIFFSILIFFVPLIFLGIFKVYIFWVWGGGGFCYLRWSTGWCSWILCFCVLISC